MPGDVAITVVTPVVFEDYVFAKKENTFVRHFFAPTTCAFVTELATGFQSSAVRPSGCNTANARYCGCNFKKSGGNSRSWPLILSVTGC